MKPFKTRSSADRAAIRNYIVMCTVATVVLAAVVVAAFILGD